MNAHVNIACEQRRAKAAEQEASRQTAKRDLIATGMPAWVAETIMAKAIEAQVSPLRVLSKSKSVAVVMARYAAIYAVKAARPELSSAQIGRWFQRDYTSILYALARYASISGSPQMTNYDLDARFQGLRKFHDRRKGATA